MNRRDFLETFAVTLFAPLRLKAGERDHRKATADNLPAGRFNWAVGPALIMPAHRPEDPCHAIKDPSIVYYQGRWHLFCTIRSQKRSHQIEYLSFGDFKDANKAERHVLKLSDGYFAAPQIFYFSPHAKWYLIYQVIDRGRKPALQPAYSTTKDITDPTSWTKPTLLFSAQPDNVKRWIDFWVICDATHAHLFFTSLNGQMWRAETAIVRFPDGWARPTVALEGDIFEASHTYCLKGGNKFLTVIEAQSGSWWEKLLVRARLRIPGRRYYKGYLADRLDSEWRSLSGANGDLFAGASNVRDNGFHWTDSFSHGELIRDSFDETLVVDPVRVRFVFQGVSDQDRAGKHYGEIPWKLGMLEEVREL